MEDALSDPCLTRRMKKPSIPEGFMFYGELRIDIFFTSQLLYRKMTDRLCVFRARPTLFMNIGNPYFSPQIVDCSFYTHRTAFDVSVLLSRVILERKCGNACINYAAVKLFWESRKKSYHSSQVIQKHNSAMLQFAQLLMHWIQTLHSPDCTLRTHCQIKILISGTLNYTEPIYDKDAGLNCHLYHTTMKAMNFQKEKPKSPVDNSKNHFVLVFVLTLLMQDATENSHYPELVEEPLRPELNFIFAVQNVTELNVLAKPIALVGVGNFGVVGKNIWNW